MAKALIRKHDLRVMHMGSESDRQVRRTKVSYFENLSIVILNWHNVHLYFPRLISLTTVH